MILSSDTRPRARSRTETPCVLLVTTQADAVQALRQPADRPPPALRLEWARDDRLALDMALRLEPRLVLIDSQLGEDTTLRLRRHLARVLPEATCYTCHERGQPVPPADAAHALHWDELPPLLRHWTPRCQALLAA